MQDQLWEYMAMEITIDSSLWMEERQVSADGKILGK